MMNFRPAWTTLPLAFCCLSLPPGQDPAALEQTVQEQAAALAEAQARLGSIESYLAAQSAAELAFVEATQASSKAGFVAGINPASREILIRAWAARAEARAKGLPASTPRNKTGKRN